MKILIVDDSVVFRTTISTALTNIDGIEVVGTAANGRVAIQKLDQIPVDLITLDMEMPDMNGIETLKAIRAKGFKVKIIVFSSQTARGAEKALEALREGADDVVAKPEGENFNFENAAQSVRSILLPKIIQFKDSRLATLRTQMQKSLEGFKINLNEKSQIEPNSNLTPADIAEDKKNASRTKIRKNINLMLPQAIVIAASTGGPSTLDKIFANLKGPYRLPIFITQHMPPIFTQILAKRLQEITGVIAKEGEHGEVIQKGQIYVAPGDFHMEIVADGKEKPRIQLTQKPPRNSVRPAADYMFESAAQVYRNGLFGIVLTGMGEDGAVGSKAIRSQDGGIMIQDKESCVVFGMPGAVFDLNEYDVIGNIEAISNQLKLFLK